MSTFGERLKAVRGERTQVDFAKELGIPQVTLSNYETNKSEPKFILLQMIVSNFRINFEWLMLGTGPMYADDALKKQKPQDRRLTTAPDTIVLCPHCVKLEEKLECMEKERRELSAENRRLWQENGDLRVRCAQMEGRQACSNVG